MKDQWQAELMEQLHQDLPLSAWAECLRTLKSKRIAQKEVRLFLNTYSNNTDQETVQDHISELLDLVEGYCQARYRIW